MLLLIMAFQTSPTKKIMSNRALGAIKTVGQERPLNFRHQRRWCRFSQ
jgi:hypothetical protein